MMMLMLTLVRTMVRALVLVLALVLPDRAMVTALNLDHQIETQRIQNATDSEQPQKRLNLQVNQMPIIAGPINEQTTNLTSLTKKH